MAAVFVCLPGNQNEKGTRKQMLRKKEKVLGKIIMETQILNESALFPHS